MSAYQNDTRGSRRLMRRALPLVLALGLFGCDDFLSTEPKAELTTASFFTTEDHALQATAATYSLLRNWQTHVFWFIGMTDIVSDDASKGSTPNDAFSTLGTIDGLDFDPNNGAFRDSWLGRYRGIYRANLAIENIPGIDMDPELRARLVGENKFLRAYYYFFLVRAYGGVPLLTVPLEAGEYDQPRASAEAVFDLIEQDLTDAIAVLPEQSGYGSDDMGRATKGAARALLARAHLFQGEYQQALEQAQAVIQSGEYSLYPDFAEIFSEAGENTSGSIWEIQALRIQGGNHGDNGAGVQYTVVQGVRGTPNFGWGFNTPSPDLEASFEPGDPRLQATIMYPWELLPDGSGWFVYLNDGMLNNRYNQKVFVPGGGPNSGHNIRRIRYADVLLTAAEAAYQLGQEAQATTWLNMVRARARGGMGVTLGFQAEALTDSIAVHTLGLSTASRVMVRYVGEGTDAYAAGLRSLDTDRNNSVAPVPVQVNSMDLITAVGGTPITDMASYRSAVAGLSAGGAVTLDVLRVQDPSGGSPTTSAMSMSVPVLALLPDVTASGQALLDAIWAERRHELAMEQHRWFDLIRQGRAAQVMESLTCEDRALESGCTPLTFAPRNALYPIPAYEVDVGGLQQNEGY